MDEGSKSQPLIHGSSSSSLPLSPPGVGASLRLWLRTSTTSFLHILPSPTQWWVAFSHALRLNVVRSNTADKVCESSLTRAKWRARSSVCRCEA
jgi:hypothetical protein